MRLPEYLEFVTDDEGIKVFGMGPYIVYIKDKRTNKVHRITIPYPPLDQEGLVIYFQRELRKALKEQLNEDIEY